MDQRLADLEKGYRERINRLAIFDPLYELGRKTGKDMADQPVDWFGLGLLSLLFFFESMLTRRRQTSRGDLAAYLLEVNRDGPVRMDEAGFLKVAQEIIDTFRGPSGKRLERVFYNWETRRVERIEYTLLEVWESDIARNIQTYRLTERGLELIFATKEFFGEFQLSISQLVLRKQLEKGELNGALREIDEMRISVEGLQRKMVQLNLEIQRNIVSHETQKKYSQVLEDIHSRLKREEEEFRELYQFVLEKKKNLEYEMPTERDLRAYRLLIQIAKELEEVHQLHRGLLDDSITMTRKALHAAKESLYHAALVAFNFNQDVTSRVVTSPLPAFALEGLVKPFLGTYAEKAWSPMDVFAEQRVGREEEGESKLPFFAAAWEGEEDPAFVEMQRANFLRISAEVRRYLGERTQGSLSEFIEFLRERPDGEAFLAHRSFYDYWLLLHQRTPLTVGEEREEEQSLLLDAVLAAFPYAEEIDLREGAETLRPHPRYEIQEMHLTIKEKPL